METLNISIPAAAKALGVGKTSAYRLIKRGELKTVRILGRQLVTVKSVRALSGEVENDA